MIFKPTRIHNIENKIKVTTYYRWEREILETAEKCRNFASLGEFGLVSCA